MLVLSRNPRQTVVITVGNRQIRITVTAICGDKVRLGFDADRDVQIDRREVYEAKLRDGK